MPTDASRELDYYRGSLYGALRRTAAAHPDLNALNFLGSTYRYDHLLEHVDGFACALANAGVAKGDVVSIMLPNCPQAVIALYAANRLGAIANVIHPLMSVRELEYSLALVGPRLLVTMDIFFDKARQAVDGWVENRGGCEIGVVVTRMVDELPPYARDSLLARAEKEELPACPVRAAEGVFPYEEFVGRGCELARAGAAACADDDADLAQEAAVLLFSGGTTGTPKAILLSNGNVNAQAAQVHAGMTSPMLPADRMLCALPLFHGFGLAVCLHTGICGALECLLVPRLTVEEYARVVVRGRCNYIVGVPTLLGKIADLPDDGGLDLSFVKDVISGGDALPAELRRRIDERLAAGGARVRVREGYGATECTAACACETPGDATEGTFGRVLAGNRARVVDPGTGADVGLGQDGELLVAGPSVMLGYWNNPAETARAIVTDADGTRWLRTGDIARMDAGGHLFYRGRIKRMIISSGYNIYPNQVEHELNLLPQVACSCVIAIPDAYRLHRIKAFVVLTQGTEATEETRQAILEALKGRIARYAWPKELEFCPALPLTKMGKVDFRALEREEERRRAAASEDACACGGMA